MLVPHPSTTGKPAVITPCPQPGAPFSDPESAGLHSNQLAIRMDTPGIEARFKRVLDSILENILINCVRLNDPLRRLGQRSAQTTVITRIKTIQSFVDEIIQLDYSDAIQAIKQENAFSASKDI